MLVSSFASSLLGGLFLGCHAYPGDPHEYIPHTESDSKLRNIDHRLNITTLTIFKAAPRAQALMPWPTRDTSPATVATSTRPSSPRPCSR